MHHLNKNFRDLFPGNVYPAKLEPILSTLTTRLQSTCEKICLELSTALNYEDEEHFGKMCKFGSHNLNLNFYPESRRNEILKDQSRMPMHKDLNLFTIYLTDENKDSLKVNWNKFWLNKKILLD